MNDVEKESFVLSLIKNNALILLWFINCALWARYLEFYKKYRILQESYELFLLEFLCMFW